MRTGLESIIYDRLMHKFLDTLHKSLWLHVDKAIQRIFCTND